MRFFCMLIFSVYKSIDKTQPFTILKVAVLFEIKRILYIRAVVLPILALTEEVFSENQCLQNVGKH